MNVALGEFRVSLYNTNFLSNKKLLSIFKNQNGYENGLVSVNTGKFTFQK